MRNFPYAQMSHQARTLCIVILDEKLDISATVQQRRGLGLDGLSIGCWQKKRGLFRSPQSTYWAWPPQTERGGAA